MCLFDNKFVHQFLRSSWPVQIWQVAVANKQLFGARVSRQQMVHTLLLSEEKLLIVSLMIAVTGRLTILNSIMLMAQLVFI